MNELIIQDVSGTSTIYNTKLGVSEYEVTEMSWGPNFDRPSRSKSFRVLPRRSKRIQLGRSEDKISEKKVRGGGEGRGCKWAPAVSELLNELGAKG